MSSVDIEAAFFAYFRGRIDQITAFDDDLDSVIDDFETLSQQSQGPSWQSSSLLRLFSKLTRLDHSETWNLIRKNGSSESVFSELPGVFEYEKLTAVAAFFLALPSEELTSSYFGKWMKLPEAPDAVPSKEIIFSNVLASLVRFNPETALVWLTDHEADSENSDESREEGMWRQFAVNYPERALGAFAREEYQAGIGANIGWALKNDFSLVPEVMIKTSDSSLQLEILKVAMKSAGMFQTTDGFPTPEVPNRLPNYRERYDSIREGIELGAFGVEEKESLL